MEIKYSLALVTSLTFLPLVRCESIVVTTRRSMSNGNIDIRFSRTEFTKFYECLCKATTDQCSVSVSQQNVINYPSRISREEDQGYFNEDPLCKNYQCHYSNRASVSNFTCTEMRPTSCQRTQSIYYPSTECGATKCVSIIWKYDNERFNYSHFANTFQECDSDCFCSTGMIPTAAIISTAVARTSKVSVRTVNASAASKTRTTTSTTTIITSASTKSRTTTLKTTGKLTTSPTTQITTALAQISLAFSEETTNPQDHRTTEINATVSDLVSDTQTQNEPVPIIVGVVVALIVLAIIAAVAVFLWKRRKGAAHKSAPDCHEYANLPAASVSTKEYDTITNVVNSNQAHQSQYVNYDIDNHSFENDHVYVKCSNQSNDDIVDKQYPDNLHYAYYEPSRSRAVAPTDGSQPKNTSSKPSDDFVSISNTLEESDDFTKSIYALANHNLIIDPEQAASASSSNKDTHSSDFHSKSSTDESHTNSRIDISNAKSHPHERQMVENDNGYSLGNPHKYTEPAVNVYSLGNAGNPPSDYEYAKQVDSTNSIKEYDYSVSNSDFDSNTAYSVAANPVNVATNDASRSHVYAKLGKDIHHLVNPYDVLQQTNAPISKQANPKQSNQGELPGQMDLYSVAEPISERPPQNDNTYSFQVIDPAALEEQYVSTYTNTNESVPGAIDPELL